MKIEIPFNAWSRKRLREGKKKSTFRYHQYGQQNDTFESEGKAFQLNCFDQKTGKQVIEEDYKSEGAESPEELRRVLNQIHRGKFDENKLGVLHRFWEVETDKGGKK